MSDNIYIQNDINTSVNGTITYWTSPSAGLHINVSNKKGKISPQLYFTYVKKKFKLLERSKLNKRIKIIEKAFDEAVENGQNMLAEKILNNLTLLTRETLIYARGIDKYIERDDFMKYKYQINGGHISDTLLKDFTRIIPKKITAKVQSLRDIFDDFLILHYYDEKIEKKLEEKQKMSSEEKSKMKDPVIFGMIKENNRLYFIDEWIDEKCDLSFDDIVDYVGRKRITNKNIKLM